MGFREVFPDNGSFFICLAYMGTFILQGIKKTHQGQRRRVTDFALFSPSLACAAASSLASCCRNLHESVAT
jgi:hypothetical protein